MPCSTRQTPHRGPGQDHSAQARQQKPHQSLLRDDCIFPQAALFFFKHAANQYLKSSKNWGKAIGSAVQGSQRPPLAYPWFQISCSCGSWSNKILQACPTGTRCSGRNTLGIVSQRRPSGRQVFKAKDTRGRKAAKGIQPPWARLRCHCCNLQREGAAPEPVLQAGQSSPCQERLAGTGTVRAVTLHPFTSCHGTHPAPRHHCHHQDSQPPLCTEASLFSAPQSTGEFYSVIHSITKTS